MLRHAVPLLLAGAVAFIVGLVVGGGHTPPQQQVAERYAQAWARADYAAMHRMLTDGAKERFDERALAEAYGDAAATATATRVRPGEARSPSDGGVPIPVTVDTRVFGAVRGTVRLPVVEEGDEQRVAFGEHLTFPGVPKGESLERTTRLPERATLLAADGTKLASGADRTSEDPELAAGIVGQMGPIPRDRARELRADGVPEDAQVGLGGIERALDDELRGRPGGELRAGGKVLARTEPQRARAVRSSIAPRVQEAASTALAGRLGGIAVLDPRNGRLLAAAGIGLSGLQPPGSTFKIITLAGALEKKITKPSERFPVKTAATLEGVELQNANQESCGGDLIQAFAHSCNSVFGPLGAEQGAGKLVETAERFGFNKPPGIDGAAMSTIPPAGEIGDDLAVGSTAIGQGRVQSTALQMAIAAATIARRGERPAPTLLAGGDPEAGGPPPTRVTSRSVARVINRGMRAVVRYGTGTSAAIPGTTVAGKTGTAELRSTQGPAPEAVSEDAGAATTAWFAAFAPASRPRVAVAVFLVGAGSGGESAAPAAKTVIQAALKR